MRLKTDLKETILQQTSELFASNGYAATSIKQIAKAADCTTAALYYYFEDGKGQILREVIQSYSFEHLQVFQDGTYDSLEDFLERFTQSVAHTMPRTLGRISWLMSEFDGLPPTEQAYIRVQIQKMRQTIQQEVAHFADEEDALMMSWLIVCTYMGFGQLFFRLGFQQEASFDADTFGWFLAKTLGVRK